MAVAGGVVNRRQTGMTSPTFALAPHFPRRHAGATNALYGAIVVSLALHVALLAITAGMRATIGVARDAAPPLRAVITVPDVTASLETLPLAAALALPPLHREPLATLTLPEIPATPAQASPAPKAASAGTSGSGTATAVILRDRGRLGPLYDRGLNEFPVEIDRGPRIEGTIVARYPPAALAAGREDSVVAWVVVNAQGEASEIEFPEGTEEFIEEVRSALRAARFQPAQDRLQPIRFPLALQFDFHLGSASAQAK